VSVDDDEKKFCLYLADKIARLINENGVKRLGIGLSSTYFAMQMMIRCSEITNAEDLESVLYQMKGAEEEIRECLREFFKDKFKQVSE